VSGDLDRNRRSPCLSETGYRRCRAERRPAAPPNVAGPSRSRSAFRTPGGRARWRASRRGIPILAPAAWPPWPGVLPPRGWFQEAVPVAQATSARTLRAVCWV